jgi:O-antigen/teichoic acid export membrane protein
MTDRNKELARNTIILGFGQLVPKFLALIVLPILTGYLSTEEFGTYDLVLSFASLLIPLMTLQIQQAVFRYLLAAHDPKDKNAYVTNSLLYVFASSAVIMPMVFIALKLFDVNSNSCLIICILFFSETLYALLGQIVRGLGNNVKYSLSVIVYSATNMILIVFLVAVLHWGLIGVILSLSLSYLTADLYMVLASGMMKYFGFQYRSRGILKELLGFSVPIVPSSIALWVVNLSDRLIIINVLGNAANGIYAVANKIPTLYNTAYMIFNLAWTETERLGIAPRNLE